MNRSVPYSVAVSGRAIEFQPLTVRKRLALNNDLIERERKKAVAVASALGFVGREAAEFVAKAVADAEKMSSLVLSCFTFEGALAVIVCCVSAEDAEWLGSNVEPSEVGLLAAGCLNVQFDTKATTAGNE